MPWYNLKHGRRAEVMFWYLVEFTRGGVTQERGWMLAADDRELVDYAKVMGFGIDIQFLGQADMSSTFPKLLES